MPFFYPNALFDPNARRSRKNKQTKRKKLLGVEFAIPYLFDYLISLFQQ